MFLTSIVILVISIGSLTTSTPADLCPTNCTCKITSLNYLDIHCRARLRFHTNENPSMQSLSDEINSHLSSMRTTLFDLSLTSGGEYGRLIKDVPSEVCNMKLLTSLELTYIGLERLPSKCFTRLPKLKSFSAICNQITILQNGLFDDLFNLESIQLQENQITSIEPLLFAPASNLASLKRVNLDDNNLTTLDTWPFTIAQAVPQRHRNINIGVNNNAVTRMTNNLNWRFHCGMQINGLELYMSTSKVVITSVNDFIKALNFNDLSDIVCLLDKVQFYPTIPGYVCDCTDYELHFDYYRARFWNILSNFDCSPYLGRGTALDAPLNRLVCNIDYLCPINCRCVNQPSNSTFHVLCPNARFTDIPQTVPPLDTPKSVFIRKDLYKYKLDFSGNNISLLHPQDYIQKASIIDLSSSGLANITDEAMLALEKVDKIYLHDNLLTTLPKITTSLNFTFTTFSFYNNPVACECDNFWLKEWLIKVYARLENHDLIRCGTPERLRGKIIFFVSDMDICSFGTPTSYTLQFQLNLVTATVSVLCISVLILFLIRHFRVNVYTKFGVHPFDRDECKGEDMLYDVFLSFAHEDSQQAREILNLLEAHSLRVCFHERDFMPGDTILENIEDAINRSKRVLCLLTDNFISSTFCLEEFERALHRHILLKRRRLIIMMSEEFELQSGLPPNGCQNGVPLDDVASLIEGPMSHLICSSSEDVSRRIDMLKNYTLRNTYIRMRSDSESWLHQLLYAMPMKRLGAVQLCQ